MPRAAFQRVKNALIATGIAMLMALVVMLDPVDQYSWLVQTDLVSSEPSGDIVFVGVEAAEHFRSAEAQRTELVRTFDALNDAQAARVYVDFVFDERSSSVADEKLATSLARLGSRAVLVNQLKRGPDGNFRVLSTREDIAGRTRFVYHRQAVNYLGLAWDDLTAHRVDGRLEPSFSADLAGRASLTQHQFPIQYSTPLHRIPTISSRSLVEEPTDRMNDTIRGKFIVVGTIPRSKSASVRIPGHLSVSPSYIPLFAAETLKSGRTLHIPPLISLMTFSLLLVGTAYFHRKRGRHLTYSMLVTAIPGLFLFAALAGIRIELSYCAALLGIYGALSWWTRWKNRVETTDADTGLPRFKVLEQDLAAEKGYIVVAKLHGYERVLKTLSREAQAKYVLKLVERLRAADAELAIYFESHFLAWHAPEQDAEAICVHLSGLRAIFANPVRIDDVTLDVGITFGLCRIHQQPREALGAAIAAAEETSESHEPIKLADPGSPVDALWDMSLRSRIDDAMAAGEIYCVYQPKYDLRSRELIGVEALVRWEDADRGFIPPMHFIEQCEKAGRMEMLTRYVLQSACSAGRLLHLRGKDVSVSVNISATLLSDMRIVGLVNDTLAASGFPSRHLVLEITETARIADIRKAAIILDALKMLGLRISMDDFGVGAANFETFFELPFDELKIDRLFVSNITRSAKARAIVSSVVAIGNHSGITVVAEGAEDDATLQTLAHLGCTQVQGYVMAAPLTLPELIDDLSRYGPVRMAT